MAKFEVRARAVDMLGRQQIAGIATAIHELFKNAHDAYATRVEADYIRSQQLLVIRDNGLGMTLEDFEKKWLALGTESKVGANLLQSQIWTGPENLPIRPVLGEKGIGRLAIATIAPITFILTRAVRKDGLSEIVAALVDWELFEIPGINIDEIDIAVKKFAQVPTVEEVAEMKSHVFLNASNLLAGSNKSVLDNLKNFNLDPISYYQWFEEIESETQEGPSLHLNGDSYGTHFFMMPTDSILDINIDNETDSREASSLRRILFGFSNYMQPGATPPISSVFRDHKSFGIVNELISKEKFFQADDLNNADHLFEGRFDEYGQFAGTLQIYRGTKESYNLNWPGNMGELTDCGPFEVRLASVQGSPDETLLDPETHREMMNKLMKYGGFYVYRDGIRVLPYGQSDYDWLKIEHRRTLSASDWYFSHRRMIGYVSIISKNNSRLIEKAGREGFRENKAFRQFREILEKWLEQIAKDFFRSGSDLGVEFRGKRNELKSNYEILIRRKSQVTERRKDFKDILAKTLNRIEEGEPNKTLESTISFVEECVSNLDKQDKGRIRDDSIQIELDTLKKISHLESSLVISRPRLFNPSQADSKAYENYLEWFDSFKINHIEKTRALVVQKLTDLRERHKIEIRKQEIAMSSLENERAIAVKIIRSLRTEAEKELLKVQDEIKSVIKNRFVEFKNELEELMIELSRTNLDKLSSEKAFEQQRAFESKISTKFENQQSILESLVTQLKSLRTDISDNVVSEETTAALENQVAQLQEQLVFYNDLAQAGSAIGIIGHEMESMIGGIREALKEIKPWADGTPELNLSYNKLRTHFDHIDGYLSLFAPLSRRVRRKKSIVTGKIILRYIRDAFFERMEAEKIELVVTEAFEKFSFETFSSTILAAYINIVDNAIYWINSDRNSERWIKFDADLDGFIIENGGPGVPVRISNQVFEFGVSMKPGGRGMGLTISKDALLRSGLVLSLETFGVNSHPKFRISTLDEALDTENV